MMEMDNQRRESRYRFMVNILWDYQNQICLNKDIITLKVPTMYSDYVIDEIKYRIATSPVKRYMEVQTSKSNSIITIRKVKSNDVNAFLKARIYVLSAAIVVLMAVAVWSS